MIYLAIVGIVTPSIISLDISAPAQAKLTGNVLFIR